MVDWLVGWFGWIFPLYLSKIFRAESFYLVDISVLLLHCLLYWLVVYFILSFYMFTWLHLTFIFHLKMKIESSSHGSEDRYLLFLLVQALLSHLEDLKWWSQRRLLKSENEKKWTVIAKDYSLQKSEQMEVKLPMEKSSIIIPKSKFKRINYSF